MKAKKKPRILFVRTSKPGGRALEAGQVVIRSKTVTQLAGMAAFQRSVHMALCPSCAENYDGTSDRMLWVMAAFVALVVNAGLASWVLPLVFR